MTRKLKRAIKKARRQASTSMNLVPKGGPAYSENFSTKGSLEAITEARPLVVAEMAPNRIIW